MTLKRRSDDESYASQKTTSLPHDIETGAPMPAYGNHMKQLQQQHQQTHHEEDRTPLASPATPANLHLNQGIMNIAGTNAPPPPPPLGNHLAMMQQNSGSVPDSSGLSKGGAGGLSKPFKCPKCTKNFATRQGLQSHTQNQHLNKKTYECPQCNKKFSANGSLKRHVDTVHKRKRDFQCLRCGKLFALKHHLKNHMITVHHEKNVDLSGVKPITRRPSPAPMQHNVAAAPFMPPRQERRESSYSVSSFGLSAPLFGMLTGNTGPSAPASSMSSLFDMGVLGGGNSYGNTMPNLSGLPHDDMHHHNNNHSSSHNNQGYDANVADFRTLLGSMNYGNQHGEDDVQNTLSSLTNNSGLNDDMGHSGFPAFMGYNHNSASSSSGAHKDSQRRTSVFEGVPVVPFNTQLGFNSDKTFSGMSHIPSMSSSSSSSNH
eukprot:CAMPEP_0171493802 /NCGR_PEP_ID=MMETSP0958-20121227/5162_1 /TAXON_ID=87120 /ORGANISM="Aurantiochytrium limacinum, Strain ATCCMYA-1381" /LENGTH=429 /DNA_ID=CAMNT_0012027461 /DNA_START=756 /DNA_END=2045 /DNA_ORIENTATION=-